MNIDFGRNDCILTDCTTYKKSDTICNTIREHGRKFSLLALQPGRFPIGCALIFFFFFLNLYFNLFKGDFLFKATFV